MVELEKATQARSYTGFVKVEEHSLYAEYEAPLPGRPTLVLLNGLSDSTENWSRLLSVLKLPGYGFLRFDFRGQGRSLEYEIQENGSFEDRVRVEDQSHHLSLLLEYFGISDPVHIVGMSYGGGVALHFAAHQPERVGKLVLVAPYVIRLDQALMFQRIWANQIELMKGWGLFPGSSFEIAQKCYHQFLKHYMNHRFQRAIPDETIRSACIQLTFGIMKFNAFPLFQSLPESSVHLISGGRDTLVPQGLYSEMWSKLPRKSKGSWLFIEDGEHLLFEQYPEYLASWIERVLKNDPKTVQSQKINGRGYSFEFGESGSLGECNL
jgi:pimeloyl-ACP methyl ester carboxylesterase